MTEIPINQKPISDPLQTASHVRENSNRTGALAVLANSFKVLVHKFGNNLDTSMGLIAKQHGLTAVSETRETSSLYDPAAERGHDEAGRGDVSNNHNDNFNEDNYREAHNSYRQDSRQDHDASRQEDRAYDRHDSSSKSQNDDFKKETPSEHSGSAGGRTKNDNNGNKTSEKKALETKDTDNTELSGIQAIAVTSGPESIQLIGQINTHNLSENKTAPDFTKLNSNASAASHFGQASKDRGSHLAETTGQRPIINSSQINAVVTGNNQTRAEINNQTTHSVQQQAQHLAQSLGDNVRMQINTSVSDESNNLTSRPPASLATSSTVNSENKGQNQTGQQPNSQFLNSNQNSTATAMHSPGGNGHGQIGQTNVQGGQGQGISQLGGKMTSSLPNSSLANSATPAASTGTSESSLSTTNIANNGQSQHSQQTTAAQQAQQSARPQQSMPSSVAEQVSVKITKALQAGQDRITIRLNPAELGRVEVKMELALDGRTTAIVTADNRDTLELLRRDSSDLQKALQEGGLDLSDGDLTFNLRGDESQLAKEDEGQASGNGDEVEEGTDGFVEQEPEIIIAHEGGVLINGRLDVRA